MTAVRLHPRVYDDIDDALAQTRNSGQDRSASMRGSLARAARLCEGIPLSASCAKISALEYASTASRRAESKRRMDTSNECTTTAPFTSRAWFILRVTCPNYHNGNSDEDHARESRFWARMSGRYKRKNAESAFAKLRVFTLCCAGAQRGLCTAISLVFERMLVA